MHYQTSSLTIRFDSDQPVSVTLRWTTGISWLPLMDRFLHFEQLCHGICEWHPIPPAKYSVIVQGAGISTIVDTLSVSLWSRVTQDYMIESQIKLWTLVLPSVASHDALTIIQSDLTRYDTQLSLIGVDFTGKQWAYRVTEWTSHIGYMDGSDFVPLKDFPFVFRDVQFDVYGGVMIGQLDGERAIFMTFDMSQVRELPWTPNIRGARYHGTWHVMIDGIWYDWIDSAWRENIRFTDWLDIWKHWRIWYVAPTDDKRMMLSNTSTSLLILLDRYTGKTSILSRDLEVIRLFTLDESPIIQTKQGAFTFSLPE